LSEFDDIYNVANTIYLFDFKLDCYKTSLGIRVGYGYLTIRTYLVRHKYGFSSLIRNNIFPLALANKYNFIWVRFNL